MKKLNMFTRLAKEDQNLVLDLCAKLPYHTVVEQVAKPRDEGGLSMTTSESSLCKFFTRHDREAIAIQAIGNYAAAVQVNQQAHGEANFEAILGLVQNRILTGLREGKSVADLDKDFRSLQRVQNCFLADTKHRQNNDQVSDKYLDFVKKIATCNEADFIRNDVKNDPGADGLTSEDFECETTQLELDLEFAQNLPGRELGRHTTFLRGAARVIAALTAAAREERYIARQNGGQRTLNSQQLTAIQNANPAELFKIHQNLVAGAANSGNPGEISPGDPSKTPAISHISPNFASPDFAKATK